jgi:hypothetical protein
MKMTVLFLGILFAMTSIHAQTQNILKKHGIKKEMLTLSKGRYKEIFTNDGVLQIGTVTLDTRTNKIVQFLDEDTTKLAYKAENASRFLTIDPLAEKYPWLSPYVYCNNNPIKYIDPDGRDWVLRYVDGNAEYYYDRSVTSQEDVNNKYGQNAGIVHISTGSVMTVYSKDGNKIQYTFTNDAKENKYGTVSDANGNVMDNSQIIYGNSYTIFGTTDESANAETLHKNLFSSSYIGPNNPQTYGNGTESSIKDSYQYQPTWSPTEMAAYNHDLSYDALGASGVGGALSPSTKCADMKLISDCRKVLNNPNSSPQERSRANKIIAGFSIINFFKPAP